MAAPGEKLGKRGDGSASHVIVEMLGGGVVVADGVDWVSIDFAGKLHIGAGCD